MFILTFFDKNPIVAVMTIDQQAFQDNPLSCLSEVIYAISGTIRDGAEDNNNLKPIACIFEALSISINFKRNQFQNNYF